jgi:hypothetical protein
VLLVHRRRLLANLLAAPLSACTASNLLAAAQIVPEPLQADSDLSPGVVIAWEVNTGFDSSIDLWTARVSDGDLSALPRCVQRIILWDDVFLHKSVHQTVGQIREAIPNYYGFDCRAEPNGSSFHLAGMNSLGEAIAAVFEAGARARIALVDLDSCGVTGLDWLQAIPFLRLHYDMIGGFARGLEESLNWLVPIAETCSFFCPSSLVAMEACDFGILSSDRSPKCLWQTKERVPLGSLSEKARQIIAAIVSRDLTYFRQLQPEEHHIDT